MRIELKCFIDVDNDTDLAEFENNFYHIDSIGSTFVDVARIDILNIEE